MACEKFVRWSVLCAGLGLLVAATGGLAPLATSHGGLQRVVFAQAATPAVSTVYEAKCSMCHGVDRRGVPPVFPTLEGVSQKYTDAQLTDLVRHGKGRMPAVTELSDADMAALLAFLKTPLPAEAKPPAEAAPAEKPQQFLSASLTKLRLAGATAGVSP